MIGGIYGYLIAGAAVVAMVVGVYFTGRTAGADGVTAEWQAANAKAVLEAENDRKRQEQLSRAQAAGLEAKLATQRKMNRELVNVAEAHIRAIPAPPPGCPEPRLTDSLLNDWNTANRGQQDPAAGGVPNPTGPATAAGGREPSKSDSQPSGGGLRVPQPSR